MSDTLVVVPTKGEANEISKNLKTLVSSDLIKIEICGFGPITAASRVAGLLASGSWSRVFLIGIAGSFDQRIPVGSAVTFQSVHAWGIGVGEGAAFQSAQQIGWDQWPGDSRCEKIGSTLRLASDSRHQLITACSASASEEEASRKLNCFPDADAEDMEGFAVAAACHMQGVPLTIVRGISNVVGMRDHSKWKIREALKAASSLAASYL